MASDETIIKKTEILQSQSTSNPTSISQWAALAALRGDQGVVKEMVKEFSRRRILIVDGLNDIPGCNCLQSEGAFYVFPNIEKVFDFNGWKSVEGKYKSENKSAKLGTYLLEESKVAVVPGIAFGSDNHIRLSFATSDDNIIKGIHRIREAIEKLV